MEIIEPMEDDRFENICDAGVELVHELATILRERGIAPSDAMAVLAVAMGGVAKGSQIDSEDAMAAIDVARDMWREEVRGDERGIIFDPAHRRPGYVLPEADRGSQN